MGLKKLGENVSYTETDKMAWMVNVETTLPENIKLEHQAIGLFSWSNPETLKVTRQCSYWNSQQSNYKIAFAGKCEDFYREPLVACEFHAAAAGSCLRFLIAMHIICFLNFFRQQKQWCLQESRIKHEISESISWNGWRCRAVFDGL